MLSAVFKLHLGDGIQMKAALVGGTTAIASCSEYFAGPPLAVQSTILTMPDRRSRSRRCRVKARTNEHEDGIDLQGNRGRAGDEHPAAARSLPDFRHGVQ